MKIWVIGRNYPTTQNKMCGSFELEQAQMLARNGHEVSYIVCPFHPLYKVKKWGATDWHDGDLHCYSYSQIFFPQRFHIYWDTFKRAVWEKLLKTVESEQGVPDVIHLHYPTMITTPEPILAYKEKGSKIIATEHWTNVLTGKITKHAKRQLTVYVNETDHFICVGNPLKMSVERITGTGKKISVIPNIVPETFAKKSEKHEYVRFIAVGRLVKSKQFDKLIAAFSAAFYEIDGVTLTVIGGGQQYQKLQKEIHKLGMEKKIVLTGSQTREKVSEYMKRSDALISYSKLETFGVPIIEAWYCGLPCIATNAIGFEEYWKESLGEIVPFDMENKLIDAMKKVKKRIEDGYYCKEDIAEYARTFFSEDAVYKQLMRLYSEE